MQRVEVPATWSVPIELPGATVLPVAKLRLPTVPPPFRVAPLLTVVAELAIEPFTSSVPAETVVGPEYVLVPVRIVVPGPQ